MFWKYGLLDDCTKEIDFEMYARSKDHGALLANHYQKDVTSVLRNMFRGGVGLTFWLAPKMSDRKLE